MAVRRAHAHILRYLLPAESVETLFFVRGQLINLTHRAPRPAALRPVGLRTAHLSVKLKL